MSCNGRVILGLLASIAAIGAVMAADVTPPAEVTELRVTKDAGDVVLTWSEVTTDRAGQPETIERYDVYRGTDPDFVPDKDGDTNRIGTAISPEYVDTGAAADSITYFYRVSAIDAAGNESNTRMPEVTTPPVLSGYWTDTTIELEWTDAQPIEDVVGYRVYYGPASGQYDFVDDVGLSNTHTLTGIDDNTNWYSAVTAVDAAGNESAFSNEHVDAIGGTIELRVHDEDKVCWGASNCSPASGHVQRSNGQELMIPVTLPEGDWVNIEMTFTLDSRLCNDPAIAPDKCGDNNPGWNPCGDPWDRTARVFLVEDDCIDDGSNCADGHENLELMRAITPFGTDAPPPDGSGEVPPRVLTLDVTPFEKLLEGNKHVGVKISTYVRWWYVTVDFRFSERPEEASPKPPADGIDVLFFGGHDPPTATTTIPAEATEVYTRLFTTGHGGDYYCDGGTNDGDPCNPDNPNCPSGECNPCDEFCHRTNRILVDGSSAWEDVPWRDDCSPGSLFACWEWNACGHASCQFSRAGWCPGYVACHHDAPCDQDLDMTGSLTPGMTHDVDYEIDVRRGSWAISLTAYWYED
jgi:fibronectin type 3 domain-containing protein